MVFFSKLWFVINVLNYKIVIVLKLAKYLLILASPAYNFRYKLRFPTVTRFNFYLGKFEISSWPDC